MRRLHGRLAHSAAMSAPLICVIEDEEVIAAAVAARLRNEGFVVEVAHDGREGIALCDRLRPDLVVLDLMLPGVDGLEVCRSVQRDRPVPVLILPARAEETDVLVGLGVGADDYMTKPSASKERRERAALWSAGNRVSVSYRSVITSHRMSGRSRASRVRSRR